MWGLGVGLAAAIIAIYSGEAMSAASQAAELFVRGVMPALFPMLALASLLPSREREPAAGVVLFSLLAGSPASARRVSGQRITGAGRLYALLGVTGVMSPMFFIGTLASWTGDQRAAWLMLISHWLGAAVAGVAGAAAGRMADALSKAPPRKSKPAAMAGGDAAYSKRGFSAVARALPAALAASAQALLAVCAAMMLFSILAALMRAGLSRLAPEWAARNGVALAAIWAALEIGGGSAELIANGAPLSLVCALCGFGGLSLLTQNLLFIGDDISPLRLLALRAVHGAASFAICSLIL